MTIALLVLNRSIWKSLAKGSAKISLRQPVKYHQKPQERKKSPRSDPDKFGIYGVPDVVLDTLALFIRRSRGSARRPP